FRFATGLSAPIGLEIADVTGDGKPDVVAALRDNNQVALYVNAGNDAFVKTWSASQSGAITVATGDLDNDGDLDILCGSRGDNTVAWYQNSGSNDSFTRFNITTTAVDVRSVAVGD